MSKLETEDNWIPHELFVRMKDYCEQQWELYMIEHHGFDPIAMGM